MRARWSSWSSNFAVWALAFVHRLTAGTDRGALWATSMYVGSASVVVGFAVWRAVNVRPVASARA